MKALVNSSDEDLRQDVSTEKKVAFYSAAVQAWIRNRMVLTRTVIALSAGGIGLLVTIMTTGEPGAPTQPRVFGGAVICFAVSIGFSLLVYALNSRYLEQIVTGKKEKKALLNVVDWISKGMFMVAVVLVLFGGLSEWVNYL